MLHQFTAAQDAQLQALQEQASSAQAQAAQAADQLDNAQTQVAEASDQLQSQNTQVSTLNTKQQTNVQELSVLLPTTPTGAPAPGPESAQGACPRRTPRHTPSATIWRLRAVSEARSARGRRS